MINERNELVMEVMKYSEIGNGLVKGKFYDVKLGMSERRKGMILGKNKCGNYEILTNYGEMDLIKRPRKYSFRDFSLDEKDLDIHRIINIKMIPYRNSSVDYLTKKFSEVENEPK